MQISLNVYLPLFFSNTEAAVLNIGLLIINTHNVEIDLSIKKKQSFAWDLYRQLPVKYQSNIKITEAYIGDPVIISVSNNLDAAIIFLEKLHNQGLNFIDSEFYDLPNQVEIEKGQKQISGFLKTMKEASSLAHVLALEDKIVKLELELAKAKGLTWGCNGKPTSAITNGCVKKFA